jgi:predicted phage tail protein
MLRDIYLHGALRERFGGHFALAVETPRETVRALCAVLPDFRHAIEQGEWRLVVRRPGKSAIPLDIDGLGWRLRKGHLHIVPAASGSGGRGVGKAIIGVALIAAAFAIPAAVGASAGMATSLFGPVAGISISYSNVALFGVSLLLSGVAQMLSPQPKPTGQFQGADARPSYLITGPQNIARQGVPVPLAYGQCMIGSVLVSAGLRAEEYGTEAADFPVITGSKATVAELGKT